MVNKALATVLSRLHGVRRTGAGWDAFCPAHEDRHKQSLSIAEGNESQVLLKCHRECSVEAIVQALGLTMPDLFNDNGRDTRTIVATYDYQDESGRLLFQVVRYDTKDFRQRQPDGNGEWIWNIRGVSPVVYRRPELAGQRNVYVVEGEKDVDRLRSFGLLATTNPMGAGKWRNTYAEQLKAAGVEEVNIIPDNDTAGADHAKAVAVSCLAGGLTVRIVRLPGLPPVHDKHGEDVSDWLNMGHTAEELEEVASGVAVETRADVKTDRGGLHFTSIGDLLNEPEEEIPWLVNGRLPAAGLSLLAGKPKAGKSTNVRCLALAVALGEPWLGFKTYQGTVFYLAFEEKRGEVRSHFRAMGATPEIPLKVFIAPSPQDGLAQLRQAAERERPALIIVDPLMKLVRVKDANDYAVVMQALEPLLSLARETGAHVCATHHHGKGERSGGDAILGSTAIFAAVDTALLLKRTDRYRTLSSIQRYGEDMEEVTLTMDPTTKVVSAGPPRREADEAQMAEAILEYLKGKQEPVEEAAIDKAVEGRNTIKVRALRTLVERGAVDRMGAGKKGDPYLYKHSGFLVPAYIWEPENQNPKTGVSADHNETYSGSHETPDSSTPRNQHLEPGNQNLGGQDGGSAQAEEWTAPATDEGEV